MLLYEPNSLLIGVDGSFPLGRENLVLDLVLTSAKGVERSWDRTFSDKQFVFVSVLFVCLFVLICNL